jgi:hypothetical protein
MSEVLPLLFIGTAALQELVVAFEAARDLIGGEERERH